MNHGHTKESLVAFEDRVAAAFEAKQVKGPVHLCSTGQAEPLLRIFEGIAPTDWCLGTWRGHWMALLKGVAETEVFEAVCSGRSMFLCFKAQRVLCSAIVGGILPIAVGLGMAIKRAGGSERVHVFAGDMCARTGLFHEAVQYIRGHDLPVDVYVEDNSLSTNANTEQTWGTSRAMSPIFRYKYERDRPHTGTGKSVVF